MIENTIFTKRRGKQNTESMGNRDWSPPQASPFKQNLVERWKRGLLTAPWLTRRV